MILTKPGPKNFLFVTWKNDAAQLAWQIQKEGHRVKVLIRYKSCQDCYDGLLEKISRQDYQDCAQWADLIIFDEIGFGKDAEMLRRSGKKVVGGSVYTDNLEWRRAFGQGEMNKVGMQVLPYREFDNFKTAQKFVVAHPGRYVFKPSGVVSSANHDLVFVGQEKNGSDILNILTATQRKWKHKIKKFMIQKYAEGVEVAVGGFFNGKKFLSPICVNQEYKRMFPDDIGPLVDDMGVVIVWDEPNGMFRKTVQLIEVELAKTNFAGFLDINCIANKHGVYPLEFTARFGYPTLDGQLAGLQTPVGEFFLRLAAGEDFRIETKERYQIGICGVLPPYISANQRNSSMYHNLPIFVNGPSWDLPGLYFKDIKLDGKVLRVAGESRHVLVATGSGKTVERAQQRAYRLLKKINVQNLFYRIDIGRRWKKDSPLLKKWGYLN